MPFSFAGEILSLLCAVTWALAIIYFRVAGSSVPAVELNLIKNTLATLLLVSTWGVVWVLFPEQHGFQFSWKEFGLLSLSGVIGITVADTLLLKSLSLIGASRNAVLSCLFSPFVIVISILFLGEHFNFLQFVGFAIVVLGTILITFQKADLSIPGETLKKGVLVGILSVLFIAIGMTITKPIVNEASPIATAAVRMTAGMLGSAIWILISGRTRKSLIVFRGPLPLKAIFVSTFLGSYLALMLWIAGFKLTDTSVASVLNQTSVLFTLLFAALILKERMSLNKLIGAALGFVGVVILFLA